MVLVDTSVWVAHLREGSDELQNLLNNSEVLCHPFIIGELACGNLKNRTEILSLLKALSKVIVAEHEEVMRLIETRLLMGRGLGYVDMHLLASALLTDVPIWTLDGKLATMASKMRLSFGKE